MAGYVKKNGRYFPIMRGWVKRKGIYQPLLVGYAKGENGEYGAWFNATNGTQADLDYIEILNDSVRSAISPLFEYSQNAWGKSANQDANGTQIGYKTPYQDKYIKTMAMRIPIYSPQLNTSSTWLESRGISISASSATIGSIKLNKLSKTSDNGYDVVTQNVIDNIKLELIGNDVRISSADYNFRYFGYNGSATFDNITLEQLASGGVLLNRTADTSGGLCSGVYQTVNGSIKDKFEWRLEIDVDYSLTFKSVASNLSRTITKTIKIRTYNLALQEN